MQKLRGNDDKGDNDDGTGLVMVNLYCISFNPRIVITILSHLFLQGP